MLQQVVRLPQVGKAGVATLPEPAVGEGEQSQECPTGGRRPGENVRQMHVAPAAEVATGFGVSILAARKWMSRYRQGGVESLADRSSRPGRCRDTLTGENACRMLALRKMRMTGDKTALRPGFCRGGVFRALRKPGCSRLASLEEKLPVARYHREMPGQLPHLDIMRLGKTGGIGHRKACARQGHRRRSDRESSRVRIDDAFFFTV